MLSIENFNMNHGQLKVTRHWTSVIWSWLNLFHSTLSWFSVFSCWWQLAFELQSIVFLCVSYSSTSCGQLRNLRAPTQNQENKLRRPTHPLVNLFMCYPVLRLQLNIWFFALFQLIEERLCVNVSTFTLSHTIALQMYL